MLSHPKAGTPFLLRYNASKECFWPKIFLNFMHGFKSAILAIFHFCQNGTFEPVHEIQKFFWPKAFFWSIMKMAIRSYFRKMSQGPPNPGFMQKKVQNLKKDPRELKLFFGFRFLWIRSRYFFVCLKSCATSVRAIRTYKFMIKKTNKDILSYGLSILTSSLSFFYVGFMY